jgi:hypothetical protein
MHVTASIEVLADVSTHELPLICVLLGYVALHDATEWLYTW